MKRNIFTGILVLFMVISMNGCTSTIGLDIQAMISPPKANVDQQEIQQLLQGDNAELTFIYPKTGEYRSAIIMKDFTGDGQEDALGFTQLETGVQVQFLVKEGDAWRLLARFENGATQVDRVCFGDINGNGQQDIFIGWGYSQNTSGVPTTLCAYQYEDGSMSEILFETKYDEMILTDFDEDGIQEVFLTQKAVLTQDETTEKISGSAQVYTIKDGQVTLISETEASDSVTRFTNITFGAVNKDMLGVVVDGAISDGSMLSQVFYLDEEKQLKSVPEFPNDTEKVNPFTRPSGSPFTAMDINKDGIIELPRATKLPAIPEDVTLDSTSFLVRWVVLDMENDSSYVSIMSTFMNISEGYWFNGFYPWFTTDITALNDTSNRAVTYFEVKSKVNDDGETEHVKGSAIFSIRVFNRPDWEEFSERSEYEILKEKKDQVYAITSYTQEKKYLLVIDVVKQTFTMISD